MNNSVTLMTSTIANCINWGPHHKIKYWKTTLPGSPCSFLNLPETFYSITVLGKQVQFLGTTTFPADSDSYTVAQL